MKSGAMVRRFSVPATVIQPFAPNGRVIRRWEQRPFTILSRSGGSYLLCSLGCADVSGAAGGVGVVASAGGFAGFCATFDEGELVVSLCLVLAIKGISVSINFAEEVNRAALESANCFASMDPFMNARHK
jgi:hypothetical protein